MQSRVESVCFGLVASESFWMPHGQGPNSQFSNKQACPGHTSQAQNRLSTLLVSAMPMQSRRRQAGLLVADMPANT